MNVSKVHSCHGQEAVVLQEQEPPAKKCSCRQIITITEATGLVKRGEAKWIVKTRTRGFREIACSLCKGDPEVKNCARCHGTGKQGESFVEDIPGTDIVYTSSDPVDEKERKKRKWLAPKTPRVATIESEHIERAYVECVPEAAARIEEYGMLILKEQFRQLATGITIEEFDAAWKEYEESDYRSYPAVPIRLEPSDNPKRGEGRNCDYGRTI